MQAPHYAFVPPRRLAYRPFARRPERTCIAECEL